MSRPARHQLRRPVAAQPARLAAAAPAAERTAAPEAAPWYRIADIRMEVVGEQTGDGEQTTTSRADVYVYDFIGGWRGSTSENFVRDVAGLDVDELHIHLNSPGGDAFEGITIANMLRQHRASITVWVDGLAASAASVIAMAGDEVVMGIGAQLMIHDASTYAWGNAADLRSTAEALDSLSNGVAAAYAAKAGGTTEEWRAVMVNETWYGGEAAVQAGLADRVATADDAGSASGEQIVPGSSTGSLWDWWDVAGAPQQHAATVHVLYEHTPPVLAGRLTPAASAGGSNRNPERSKPVAFSDEQLTTMRQQLGLAEDADEATIVAALTEALDERAETPTNSTTSTATASLPEGVVAIDASVLDYLRTRAEAGVRAEQRQQEDRRQQLVSAALRDGRIRSADRDRWLNNLKRDPEGTEATLAALEPGLVPVSERGHDQDGATETPEQPVSLHAVRETAAYKNWSA